MLSSSDRLLISWNTRQKEIPPRPRTPSKYPKTDARHWHDMEYAGWGIPKHDIHESPGDGARGKRVAFLQPGLHPYYRAFAEGLTRIAERAGVDLQALVGAMSTESQDAQVQRAITERPDLVILVPISSEACTRWVRRLHGEGIPVIVSNFFPNEEAYRHILAWSGPDDWGQYRMLARSFADRLRHTGGYAIVRHIPGSSCYASRTWSVVTELAVVAPRMRCLAMGDGNHDGTFDPAMVERLVAGWLGRFGSDLRGIVGPDDDITVDEINAAQAAADWFNGKGYALRKNLAQHVITQADVDGFYPPQW